MLKSSSVRFFSGGFINIFNINDKKSFSHINCYSDIKGVKESKHHFDKISNDLDLALNRNSQVSDF